MCAISAVLMSVLTLNKAFMHEQILPVQNVMVDTCQKMHT